MRKVECVYDPTSDHRRKGVYKEKIDSLKTKNSTLQTLVQAILNAAEDDVPDLVRQIRTCESLDDVAKSILRHDQGLDDSDEGSEDEAYTTASLPAFETELSRKMGELRLENGSVRFLGGTSNLIYLEPTNGDEGAPGQEAYQQDAYQQQAEPLKSWTSVTDDVEVIVHLINMYFTWHYTYFTTLSKSLFYRDFLLGKAPGDPKRTVYCSSLLVNAMLALGCHFTTSPAGCARPDDPTTKGDAFFAEAKRLIFENDEYEKPRLTTIQALCLMSVREAGCGREAKGWVYSGMAFRMAQDMGLNLDSGGMSNSRDAMDEQEIDARRVTFWGCFLFDKCWSSYLGRIPQLPVSNITAPKYDVFPDEEADIWSPYTDSGIGEKYSQPSRTRTVALQISKLCEISSDLLNYFYHPQHLEKSVGKSQELKMLSSLQTRLETWRNELPKELEAKEGQLPNVLLMQCVCSVSYYPNQLTFYSMFFNLLYIHLFRPFLKYNPSTSPLPSHVSPRKVCIHAASSISKLMRLYKRTYGLRQICNIAVYIVHSACTIHLLNLPGKDAKRDIIHGVKNLEEIAEDWLCARRTLSIISVLARKWKSELPEEATAVLARTDAKYGFFSTADVPSPKSDYHAHSPSAIPSVQATPNVVQKTSDVPHNQNSLMESLYSYALPADGSGPSTDTDVSSMASSKLHLRQRITSPSLNPPRSTPSSDFYNTSASTSRSDSQQPSNNTTTSDKPSASSGATFTRGINHGALFGGVEMLVESQDSWLRDQANLPVGFDNWMSTSSGGQGAEFFLGELGRKRSDIGYGFEEGWPSYN